MKGKRARHIIISVILILADIALFFALVKLLRWPLVENIGFDICDYASRDEFQYGYRVYRFGAGCYEYLFVIVKAALLIFFEKISLTGCKGYKAVFVIAVILHVILLVLNVLFIFRFLDGGNIFWLIRYFLTGAEPPF